jgi:hypothetical protein
MARLRKTDGGAAMTDRAIVSGVLFRAPATKTSKAGKPYVFATIRSGSGEAARWWKCFVFSETAIEEISQLGDGDPIAVAGEFDCELYAPAGGESRLSWRITADAVLTAKRGRKSERETAARRPGPLRDNDGEGGPNDGLPF